MNHHLHQLTDETLESAEFDDETKQWVFCFTGEVALRVWAPWRVVSAGQVVLGYEDEGQWFGNPAPTVVAERVRVLGLQRVLGATTAACGDLLVGFGDDLFLQVFNDSCGYEGWQLYGPGDQWVVAQGGGRIVWSEGAEPPLVSFARGQLVELDGLLAVVVGTPEEGGAPEGHLALWYGDPRTTPISQGGAGGRHPEVWTVPAEYCKAAAAPDVRH